MRRIAATTCACCSTSLPHLIRAAHACTSGDSCQGGVCKSGTTDLCAPPPPPASTMFGFGIYFPDQLTAGNAGLPRSGSYLVYARADYTDGSSQYPANNLVTWTTITNSACVIDAAGYIHYVASGYGFCALEGVYTDPQGTVWTAAPIYIQVQN